LAGITFIPTSVEILGNFSKLHSEVARKVLRADFPPLLAPESNESGLVVSHDDAGIGASDEALPV
jgi:hypothetical protein